MTTARTMDALLRLLAVAAAAQLAAGQTTLYCSTASCTDTARSSASCTGSDDYGCLCQASAYGSVLSSCLLTQKSYNCQASDWTSASSERVATCSSASSSLGSSLCDQCFTSAVTSNKCINEEDLSCLCGTRSAGVLAFVTSCGKVPASLNAACPVSNLASVAKAFTSSCNSYQSVATSVAGCPLCEVAAAAALNCSGGQDYNCLCAKDQYLTSVSSCISTGNCYATDYTAVRNSYTSACAVVATGGTPTDAPARKTGAAGQTGSSAGSKASKAADSAAGPSKTPIVIGVVAGIIVLLFLLCIGGYLLFRKRRSPPAHGGPVGVGAGAGAAAAAGAAYARKGYGPVPAAAAATPPPPPPPPFAPYKESGAYEMHSPDGGSLSAPPYGHVQGQGQAYGQHGHQNGYAAPYGQATPAGQYSEMDSNQGMVHQLPTNEHYRNTLTPRGYVELGPSR